MSTKIEEVLQVAQSITALATGAGIPLFSLFNLIVSKYQSGEEITLEDIEKIRGEAYQAANDIRGTGK